eukprot:SAG11_NODE_10736_length_809_cov_0.861972_2_plen_86_part_01
MAGAGTCTKRPCLFDLSKDPRETHDLSAKDPATTHGLLNRYKQLATELYAPNMDESSTTTRAVAAVTADRDLTAEETAELAAVVQL